MVAKHAQSDRVPLSASDEALAMKKIGTLEDRYQFREPDAVRAFLVAHPEVINLALQASSKIPELLPVDEGLALEVSREPEDVDDPGQLFAIVPTCLDPGDVRPYMDRLLDEWLVTAGRPVGLLFNVDVEYQ